MDQTSVKVDMASPELAPRLTRHAEIVQDSHRYGLTSIMRAGTTPGHDWQFWMSTVFSRANLFFPFFISVSF
jgi:hypothetical protein